MKKTIVIIACASVALISCSGNKHSNDIIISQEINMEHRFINPDNKVENNAHSGKYYTSVDSIHVYSTGYAYVLPDSLKNKNVTVYVSAWVREQEAPFEGEVNIGLTTTKGTVGWHGIKVKDKNYTPNQWIQVKDSIKFTSTQINDSFSEIGVIGIKNNGRDKLDIDDIQIKYKFSK